MKSSFLLVLCFASVLCFSQKQGNNWYFGDHAGLNFNTNPPSPLLNGQTYFVGTELWNEGCSSISDSSGALLFYSNGVRIWDRNQLIMPNGDSLLGNVSSTQSCVILPLPNSSRLFYVFTSDAVENHYANGLRYSLVDMCMNGGNGDVIVSQKNVLLLDTIPEKMTAIKNSNGIDYWILTHKYNSDAFYAFDLSSSGMSTPVISHTGKKDSNQAGGGQMIISPNGTKIGYTVPSAANGFSLLLDFNTTTGIVSNQLILDTLNTEYGISFSPDNSKLYFSTVGHGELFQYNLNAGSPTAIIASKTWIFQGKPDSWRAHQLGPDGQIYIARAGKNYLSLIASPNSAFPGCNYIDSAIYLGGKLASFGLPNLISSYSYSNSQVLCPTNIEDKYLNIVGSASPNPTDNLTNIPFQLSGGVHQGFIVIYNIQGQEMKCFAVDKTFTSLLISTSDIPAGTYYYQLQTSGNSSAGKKLIVIK
ncbi:MAG TPA: T9SS type A sorting domain-containing protein [Bacteroidia bacterium]|jgi:hypothetical protein|nr:T9SS type A sorting domain-containing protein [Bacteroidia bacterium]